MDNMNIYEKVRSVPREAQKTIKGGRLSGFTDINPMWRIKVLTEIYGPCGIGWFYEIVDKRIEDGTGGERAAFMDILLYVHDKEREEWSKPIPGTGGNMFIAKEKTGLHTNDECFKMALSDAISVAAKSLGIGADVYWNADSTKYTRPEVKEEAKEEKKYVCAECGKEFQDWKDKKGKTWKAGQLYHMRESESNDGRAYCKDCLPKHKKEDKQC